MHNAMLLLPAVEYVYLCIAHTISVWCSSLIGEGFLVGAQMRDDYSWDVSRRQSQYWLYLTASLFHYTSQSSRTLLFYDNLALWAVKMLESICESRYDNDSSHEYSASNFSSKLQRILITLSAFQAVKI